MTATRPTELAAPAAGADTAFAIEADEVCQLITSGLETWTAYWTACLGARGLGDLLRANVAFVAESCSLAGQAAARRQSFGGLISPTLNEA